MNKKSPIQKNTILDALRQDEVVVYHPYLHYFDSNKIWKNLIIGTFPPNPQCENRKGELEFFYGNKASIWKILKNTNLYLNNNFDSIENIEEWQNDYSIGITDVLTKCRRKLGEDCSSKDKDLVINFEEDLNFGLKEYIINNKNDIDKLYFTSSGDNQDCNSALWLFKKLMGRHFESIPANKIVKLPTPSGEFLRSKILFPGTKMYFGLSELFYNYLNHYHPGAINIAKRTWNEKINNTQTRKKRDGTVVKVNIKRFPDCPNYPELYRLQLYKELLPKNMIEK